MATTVNRTSVISSENSNKCVKSSDEHIKQSMQSRKTLQTLQYTAGNTNQLVGKNKEEKPQKIKPTKNVKVFVDNAAVNDQSGHVVLKKSLHGSGRQCSERVGRNQSTSTADSSTDRTSDSNTDEGTSQEAFDLMVTEPAPEVYWKEVAEQRRMALLETLHENEQLHHEIAMLKEENERLSEMANQADYFATILKNLIGENDLAALRQEDDDNGNISDSETDSDIF